MKEQLKQLRTTLKLSQQKMAENLSCTVRAYRSYEYETKNYPTDFILKLFYVYNVNLNWFFTGEGGMFNLEDDNELDKKIEQKIKEILNKDKE